MLRRTRVVRVPSRGAGRAPSCQHGCPPAVNTRPKRWTGRTGPRRNSWISALTVPVWRSLSFVLPEGAARDQRTEITSRLVGPRAGRFGRFFAHSRVGSARRDVIGIPVSVLSSRRSKQRRQSAARPRARGVGVSGADRDLGTGHPGRRCVLDPARPIPPSELPARLDALEAAVRARTSLVPRVGIVLGSGLGGLADDLDISAAIPFAELPGWPAATAPGPRRPTALRDARRRARRCSSRDACTCTRATQPGWSCSRCCSWAGSVHGSSCSRMPPAASTRAIARAP